MTSAIYYEAGSESADGQRAVAQVILNRVRHPAYPNTVCGVVYQGSSRATGCQFTFTCDGSLNRQPSQAGWLRARKIAEAAIAGDVFAPVGLSTHYHADFVVPYWAGSLIKNAVIGAHIFYRWPGGWGQPGAFMKPYRGGEPNADALYRAAMARRFDGPAPGSGSNVIGEQQLTSVAVQLEMAEQSLGANNPTMKKLRKQNEQLVRKAHNGSGASLANVEKELARASLTLGPRHPKILALEGLRDQLKGKRHSAS